MKITKNNYEILVDDVDLELLEKHKWTWDGKYPATYIDSKKIRMHTMLMPGAEMVDHINMDTRDNRRSNLRYVTKSQNMINRGLQKNNTSGFKGVHLLKKTGKWQSHIKFEGKRLHLGYYRSAQEAAYIYDQVCLQLFGEYAKCNIL